MSKGVKLDVIYRKFSFEKYPEWVNIRNEAGQWAWKSQCIKQVTDENSINDSIEQYVIWCDSRNKIRNNSFFK